MACARWVGLTLCAALFAVPAAASPSAPAYVDETPRIPDLSACPTLDACLALLDAAAPAHDNGGMDMAKTQAAVKALQRFGEPAKQALLDRALGPRPGLRNEAGAILSEWPSWSPADVPKLAAGLAKQHGGWLARPLAKIGDPAAIEALVGDLQTAGPANQTDFALAEIGPVVLPRLMPLLEQPAESAAHKGAWSVIRDLDARAGPAASDWVAVAADQRAPHSKRLAALAAIEALGPAARVDLQPLRPLLHDADRAVAGAAHKALVARYDPAVAADVASACRPSRALFTGSPSSSYCLYDLGRFKAAPEIAGPAALAFVQSPNGDEAALAIRQLGKLEYAPAGAALVMALSSPDWRVVYAAAGSLGRLGPKAPPDAAAALRKVAETHWLPEVRERAALAEAKLAQKERFIPPAEEPFDPVVSSYVSEEERLHPCLDWRWNGRPVAPSPVTQTVSIRGGQLQGRDRGEWGGELLWTPKSGHAVELLKDNIQAVQPIEGGRVLALGGVAHMVFDFGYVLLLEPDGQGWRLREVARLPGQFKSLGVIGPDTYAAFSFKRVVVFNASGIIGMASCAARR